MSKNPKQTIIVQNWFEDFSCVGGTCPLTCCNVRTWGIKIDDPTYEKYKAIDGPFKEILDKAVNIDNQCFKSCNEVYGQEGYRGELCALLEEDGLCSLVKSFGDDILCETCATYPRTIKLLNNYIEQYVDITCPIVAEYLLSDKPLTFKVYKDVDFTLETKLINNDLFLALMDTREFLIDLFSSVDGFTAGKCYLMFEIANGIQNIIDSNTISAKAFDCLLSKYSSEETLIAILEECESFVNDPEARGRMFQVSVNVSSAILKLVPNICYGRLDGLERNVNKWLSGVDTANDLKEFYEYRDQNFPNFVDKMMVYRLSTNWITEYKDLFAQRVKVGFFLTLIEEICGMSIWKDNGKSLSIEDYSFIISSIERDIFHSKSRIDFIAKEIKNFEDSKQFSFFLLPVY